MFCISVHTLSDLLFYHIDHLDFDGITYLYRHYDLIDGILYLFFDRVSDGASVCFSCVTDDRILYELNFVN